MKANYEEKQKVNGSLNMSMYELNKCVVRQLPSMTEEQLAAAGDLIDSFQKENKYFMLLGKDLDYYTIFQTKENMEETMGEAVIDCLSNLGDIKAIDLTPEEQTIEIWITQNSEAYVLYLFNYDEGVILCQ